MSKGIEGKVVVIAGASSGLGEARRSKGRHALALSAVRALCCRVGRVEHKPHALIQRRVQRRVPGARAAYRASGRRRHPRGVTLHRLPPRGRDHHLADLDRRIPGHDDSSPHRHKPSPATQASGHRPFFWYSSLGLSIIGSSRL